MSVSEQYRNIVWLFIMVACPAFACPADDAKINIFVTTTSQDSPLQVVGFRLPDKVGSAPMLVVLNISDKEVREFGVEAAVGDPEESARVETGEMVAIGTKNGSGRIGWPQERMVPPNNRREAHETIFEPHHLAAWGQRLHSNCLHVAAIVTRVKFADGTSWELENFKDQTIWRSSLKTDSAKSCGHSPEIENALKQWSGAAGNASTGSLSHVDPGIVKSYSITCPLRMTGSELAAICPW